MIAAALLLTVLAQTPTQDADRFLGAQGVTGASQHYRAALDTFLQAEALTFQGKHREADRALAALWMRYPVGSDAWARLPGGLGGLNLGTPPCYYALRMLTDINRWRLASGTRHGEGPGPPEHLRLLVVLVGEGEGREAADEGELARGEGRPVVRRLDPRLVADEHALIHESLALFREYVSMLTGGRLGLAVDVFVAADLRVALYADRRDGARRAALADPAPVFAAVPQELREAADWWWILHPSHLPQGEAFRSREFITGGMGRGPDGSQPLFLIDDLWLARKPPHLGAGDYSPVERRAYLPQWLQHEFFHHLFGTYTRFELEATSHQWFDRARWPADFVGRFEPDYFHEALFKRLLDAEPPLHVMLRHAARGLDLGALSPADLVGTYVREPVENDWHRGEIELGPEGGLRWRNAAGVAWSLAPDLARGRLRTGPDCPYHTPEHPSPFVLVPAFDPGERVTGVAGFRFGGGLYARR